MVRIFYWNDYPQIEKRLKELYEKFGSNYEAINDVLNEEYGDIKEFTMNSTRNRIRRSPIIQYYPNRKGEGIFKGLAENELYNDYTDVRDIIKETKEYFDKKYGDREIKILFISDLHIPKEDLNVLEQIILKNQDCDVLVIAGDLLDYDNLSRFNQKKNINVTDEYKRGYDILERITPLFEDVFICSGNHEVRFTRYIENKVVTALSSFLTNRFRPLDPIVKYFDNVTYVPHWFFHIGQVIVSHPSRYSSIEGRTVRNVIDNRIEKKHKEEFGEYSTVICGHTHRTFKGEFSGKIAIENGCIEQKEVEFANADAKGKNWHHGCTVVKMKNLETNWNDIEVMRFDV